MDHSNRVFKKKGGRPNLALVKPSEAENSELSDDSQTEADSDILTENERKVVEIMASVFVKFILNLEE